MYLLMENQKHIFYWSYTVTECSYKKNKWIKYSYIPNLFFWKIKYFDDNDNKNKHSHVFKGF